MHVRFKLNSQVYVNLTRYHWNRIIVELSAKYIDLLYLKRICHNRDKRYTPWKILCVFWFVFIFYFLGFVLFVWLYVGFCRSWTCLTYIRTSPMVREMPVLNSEFPFVLYVTSAWETLIWLYTWPWASGSKCALTKI